MVNYDGLNALHDAVCEELLNRIKSGSAASGDISNAIRFLKDNGVLWDSAKPIVQEPLFELPSDEEIDELLK